MASGDKFKEEGERALSRMTIFGFGKQQKYEDASTNFAKAGNAYKMANQMEDAGHVYMQAAEAQKLTDSPSDAANFYVEAGNCFRKCKPIDAIQSFTAAVAIYEESMRNSQCARYYLIIAEIYEQERDTAQAVLFYKKAAHANEIDNKKQGAKQSYEKIAHLCSLEGETLEAAKIYEDLAKEGLESRLGQYSSKGYLFQAGLCILASGDNVLVRNKLDLFKNLDFNFASSRECQFLEALVKTIDDFDADGFAQACADFDRITPLDPWKTSMLVKCKRGLTEADNDNDLA